MSRSTESKASDSHSGGRWFEPTQWTVILKAREEGAAGAAEALEKFAHSYWQPTYRYIRRDGYNRQDAQDLTQGFYQHFLEKQLLHRVSKPAGKFRTYLLTCLNHFLSDERARAAALKRGGDRTFIALDALEAEERDAIEPADTLTPDQIYDRRWGQAIMTRAIERLRSDYAARGKTALFEQLKDLQPGEHGAQNCAQIGLALGMSEQAVKNARYAFQRNYARCLRQEVAQTVGEPGEVSEELDHLFRNPAR